MVDLVASRGGERILDLNGPLEADLVGGFDVVLDAGTMEHCFNVGQAVRKSWTWPRSAGSSSTRTR